MLAKPLPSPANASDGGLDKKKRNRSTSRIAASRIARTEMARPTIAMIMMTMTIMVAEGQEEVQEATRQAVVPTEERREKEAPMVMDLGVKGRLEAITISATRAIISTEIVETQAPLSIGKLKVMGAPTVNTKATMPGWSGATTLNSIHTYIIQVTATPPAGSATAMQVVITA